MIKNYKTSEVINLTLEKLMKKNKNIVCFGLGVDDPKSIFNTTKNLQKKFGKNRVFDTPASENAMTGIGIGMSLNGKIPIMVHQRLDFFLLAMDQLVNNASKWNIMFGGKNRVPITIRLIIGRGWGQGPTHSQNLQSWFAHVPGLKVVAPSFPSTMKNLLIDSILDPDPVIIIEHRWIHNIEEKLNISSHKKQLGKVNLLNKGKDITLISSSYSTIEILKIYETLKKNNVSFDHIDLLSIKPLDMMAIYRSVKKTGKLLVLDNSSHSFCSVSSEIVSQLTIINPKVFKKKPLILNLPEIASPSSFYLTKKFYKSEEDLLKSIEKILNKKLKRYLKKNLLPHDVPDQNFTGPF
tara:strand:+ start:1403 stop:2458 length:1056 start_codon:yes stop_codon:yes gene_type:complete